MDKINFAVTIIVQDFYDKIEDMYLDGHLQLVYLREGVEGIVDSINIISKIVYGMGDIDIEDDEDVYSACEFAMHKYLNARSDN